jgi:hypothetical protein
MTVTLEPSVEEFIGTPRQLFINGQWVDAASGKTFETPDPATGETLARVAEGDAEDIDRAVRAARKAFEEGPWSRMTPSERGRIVWRIGDLILEHVDELAQLESLDNGKPYPVAQAADVPLAADLFHYMAGWATKKLGPRDGSRGARGLHGGEGRHHAAVSLTRLRGGGRGGGSGTVGLPTPARSADHEPTPAARRVGLAQGLPAGRQ